MVIARQVTPLHQPDSKEPTTMSLSTSIPSGCNNNNNNNNKGDGISSNSHNSSSCPCPPIEEQDHSARWSHSNTTWTWNESDDRHEFSKSCCLDRKCLCLIAGVISVILVITVVVTLLILLGAGSKSPLTSPSELLWTSSSPSTTIPPPSPTPESPIPSPEVWSSTQRDRDSDSYKKIEQERRRLVSKMSWDMLNRSDKKPSSRTPTEKEPSNDVGDDDEVILSPQMVFTSINGNQMSPNNNPGGEKKRSCCRTQKYAQVIQREGCDPVTIVNRMCFGQCVSVWVPGLFASFPVCRPSRSTWKTVTLTCGRKRDRRKRVKVERVRRCSCMEIEPTDPPTSL